MRSDFLKLPSELLHLILERSCSPQDLLNLICASRRCNQIFSSSPLHFMRLSIESGVGSVLWYEYCAVFLARKRFGPILDEQQFAADKPEVRDFIHQYFNGTLKFDIPASRQGLDMVFDLQHKIKYLIRSFTKNALQEANQLQQMSTKGSYKGSYLIYDFTKSAAGEARYLDAEYCPGSPIESDTNKISEEDALTAFKVTSSESHRLCRALLQFELHCRLFRPRQAYEELRGYTAAEQFHLFLEKFSVEELEGIACIHQYLSGVVEGTWEDLESEFEAEVRRLAGSSCDQKTSDSRNPFESAFMDFSRMGLGSLIHFSSEDRFFRDPNTIIVSAGINRMVDYLQSDLQTRFIIIRSQITHVASLGEALDLWSERDAWAALAKSPTGDEAQAPITIRALRMVKSITLTSNIFYLRNIGCVFWDQERLDSEPFDQAILQLARTRNNTWKSKPSSEDRLRDVKLPIEYQDFLEDKYGVIEV